MSANKAVERGFCTLLHEKEIVWLLEKETNEKLIGFPTDNDLGLDLNEKFLSVNHKGKIISVFM